MYRFKKLCISVVIASCIGLVACEGTESRKEKYIGVGLEMLEQGNLEKARISFKNVLKIDPKDIKANFYYAKTLEKLEDWPAAAGQYKHVLDLKPDHTEAAIALGKILLLAKAADQALEQAENVINREQENPDALVLKAGALLIKGETDAGVVLVDRVLAAHPGHADASILRSSIYLEKRDLLMAEKVLKTASEADSKNVSVLVLLSRVYAMQAKNAEAEAVLKAIISAQPRPEHYSKLAEFYFRAKQYAESEKTLTDGIKAFPDSEPLKRTLISVIEAQGDVTRAESALKTFIKSSDEPEVLSVYLAEKLFQWQRESDAEKLLNEIAEQKVSSKAALSAMNMLAVYKQSKGESEQALALIDKVLEKNANDVQALNFRARVSLEKGNYDGAVNDLRSALNQEKNNVQLMKPLVLAYLKRGDI
ncbi:MAG TPA: tetratricopeptide repeat protein, partial [Pseudomonadales bacterium]|nr:tetratricopeptide repeat protein [Pseudomonadales bacterium]